MSLKKGRREAKGKPKNFCIIFSNSKLTSKNNRKKKKDEENKKKEEYIEGVIGL